MGHEIAVSMDMGKETFKSDGEDKINQDSATGLVRFLDLELR